jgi:hypothetical protein
MDSNVRSGQAISEYMHLTVGVTDSQGALADEIPKQFGQQMH